MQTEGANPRGRANAAANAQDFVTDDLSYNLGVQVDPLQQPAQQPSQSSYGGGGNSQSTQGIYLHPTM